nr:MarR family transcriptional regulator [Tomitella biformata]
MNVEGDRVAVLARDFTRATTRLSRILRTRQVSSVSLPQISALVALLMNGPMTPGGLANYERVKPPSMTRVLGLLESSGLIDRTKHPTDGRQAIVAISSQGKALLLTEQSTREKWLREKIEGLTSDQRNTLCAAASIMIEISSE